MDFATLTSKLQKISFSLIIDILYEQKIWAIYKIRNLFIGNVTKHSEVYLEFPKAYKWLPTKKWFLTIIPALTAKAHVRNSNVPQNYKDIVTVRTTIGNKTGLVAFDFSDKPDQIDKMGLEDSCTYFKMQYLQDGYENPKIVPGQFIPGSMQLYWALPILRKLRMEKPIFEVYGRFGAEFAQNVRGKALQLLREQSQFAYTGEMKIIRYSRYLREIAQSKICIDLPGNGPFCFRLIEYLAVGACIISPPHQAIFSPKLEDGIHIKYCKADLSDLVDICNYYLKNDTARLKLSNGAKDFFDKYLSKDKIAEYYLQNIKKNYTIFCFQNSSKVSTNTFISNFS